MTISKNAILCFFMLVIATLFVGCVGITHKVGDSEGWASGVDYSAWVTSRYFHVGDSVVFQYNKDVHDVMELGSSIAFEFCDLSSTVARYKTGYDVVNLTRPGRYYFVCGTPGHCENGQKVNVLVTSRLPPDVVFPRTQTFVVKSRSSANPSLFIHSPVANAPPGTVAPLHNNALSSTSILMCSILLAFFVLLEAVQFSCKIYQSV